MTLDIAFLSFSKLIELSDGEKEIFQSLAQVVQVKRKQYLLQEGQVCRYEYFVLQGCLRSFYIDRNSTEHTTMFAVEGWWTGNMKSFLKQSPSDFSIQAIEDTVLLRLNKLQVEELYSKVPKFERYFRILLQNRLLATQERVAHHLSSSASEKYRQFLEKFPNIEKRVPLKHIASYLGITPTYLSRLRKIRVKH
jgi:CRP-like cAMP-binding protein